MQNGIPLNDSDRLPWLEKLSLIIQEYHAQNQSIFLSCSALKQHYREILKGKLEVDGEPFVRFIWLDIDSDLAQERCRARATHFFPTSLIESQILTLDMTPAECFCHVQVTREKSQTEILREILDEII
jgi:carbohydrate kinase (thermoresistant glucokinase family)